MVSAPLFIASPSHYHSFHQHRLVSPHSFVCSHHHVIAINKSWVDHHACKGLFKPGVHHRCVILIRRTIHMYKQMNMIIWCALRCSLGVHHSKSAESNTYNVSSFLKQLVSKSPVLHFPHQPPNILVHLHPTPTEFSSTQSAVFLKSAKLQSCRNTWKCEQAIPVG